MTADSPVGVDGATAASIPERLISGPSRRKPADGKVLLLLDLPRLLRWPPTSSFQHSRLD